MNIFVMAKPWGFYQFCDLFYSKLISLKFKAAVLKSSTGFINEYSIFFFFCIEVFHITMLPGIYIYSRVKIKPDTFLYLFCIFLLYKKKDRFILRYVLTLGYVPPLINGLLENICKGCHTNLSSEIQLNKNTKYILVNQLNLK